MNSILAAISLREMPWRRSAFAMSRFIVAETWSCWSRVMWKALFSNWVARISASGFMPRAAVWRPSSMTMPTAPIPIIMPLRRRSKGRAASLTTSLVLEAPVAKNPVPIQPIRVGLEMSSAATTMTRLARPVRIQSSAIPTAWVVEAQAALICVQGPMALMYCEVWAWPSESTRNRKERLNL